MHLMQYRTYKIIYRRYAGLFFSMCIDVSDNELALIEAIHLFVEILDHYFENVCELDLVFNFHKVCWKLGGPMQRAWRHAASLKRNKKKGLCVYVLAHP